MFGVAGLLFLLAALVFLASVAASIWLVVVAFKKSVAWGLLVLLVPFAAIVFAVKCWGEARKPFLISLASGVASGLIFMVAVGAGTSAISGQLANQMSEEFSREMAKQMDAAAAAQAEQVREDASPAAAQSSVTAAPSETGSDDQPGSAPPSDPPALPASLPSADMTADPLGGTGRLPLKETASGFDPLTLTPDGYARVPLPDASRALGRRAKVIGQDGRVRQGEVTKVVADSIELQYWLGSGTVTVRYPRTEIKTLLVKAD